MLARSTWPDGSHTVVVRYNGRTVISQARTVQAGRIVDRLAHWWWRLAHPVSPSLLLILDEFSEDLVEPGVHALASSFNSSATEPQGFQGFSTVNLELTAYADDFPSRYL
jgi:hypothetical protein